ncbi:MAG: cation:proton antiporter [Wenzhouxiangellaceae bacterium]|nr:cation:proton antiporter [Wenzhouxiangellaceae bacterium]
MTHWTAVLIALAFLAYALASRRLSNSIVTGPMLFAGLGLLIGPQALGWVEIGVSNDAIRLLAEITLVVVLFTDAAHIDIKVLRQARSLPSRMLLIGLPLTVVLGTLGALGLFPHWTLWEAALLAAILAPTDAALGQAVTENESVPERIRSAISTESGLNDGLALPLVLLFAALASGASDAGSAHWVELIGLQILLGPLVGAGLGFAGGRLIGVAHARGWMSEWAEGIAAMSIALGAFVLAEAVHGNGFLAAFVGGLAFGKALGRSCRFLFEFQQTEAHMLVLVTFAVVGAMLLPAAMEHFTVPCFLFSVFALTLMRMLPIALSMTGLKLGAHTVGFLGWFGPRGLASVLFVLVIMQGIELEREGELLAAVVLTVGLSIILHGVSAAPWAKYYGRLHGQSSTDRGQS